MVPAIFSKKFRSESVLAGSKIRTSTTGTVNNKAIETDLVLILISPYQINHLTGNIPSHAGFTTADYRFSMIFCNGRGL